MAYTTITLPSVASGEPVTTDFGVNVINNLDDHESRLTVIEVASATNEYDAIVSNPAIAGFSTHTTISAALGAVTAGSRILVLRGTFTENIGLTGTIKLEGSGADTIIVGNISFNSTAKNCILEDFYFDGTLTFASGGTGNVLTKVIVPNTFTEASISDANAFGLNNYFIMGEV